MVMRAAVIANTADADTGLVGRALRSRGYAMVEYLREQHDRWPGLEGIDMVVAMGSSWSTYWDHVAEPVAAEQDLIGGAMAANIPVLGICFGAQQLSTVLGGQVTKAQSPEIGWCQVDPVPETAHLAPPVMFEGPWMQWHYDRFSVPPGATVLAQSPVGPQAIVCGRAFGVQFHPEATESIVRTWASHDGQDELVAQGISGEGLLRDTSEQVVGAESRCDALVAWYLDNVAQGHMDTRLTG